jgi:hypothetical protein
MTDTTSTTEPGPGAGRDQLLTWAAERAGSTDVPGVLKAAERWATVERVDQANAIVRTISEMTPALFRPGASAPDAEPPDPTPTPTTEDVPDWARTPEQVDWLSPAGAAQLGGGVIGTGA